MKKFKLNKNSIVTTLAFSAVLGLFAPATLFAATAPVLGTNSTYGVVSSTYTGTIAATAVTGNVCYTGAPTIPPTLTSGTATVPCTAGTNGTPQSTALTTLTTQTCTDVTLAATTDLNAVVVSGNTAGTFPPGCYSVTGAMDIVVGTSVTLNLTATGGDGGNVWVFRSAGALTTAATTALFPSIVLANGANAANVFWAPTATSLGANYALVATPSFMGTIIDPAGITIGHFANLLGRALDYQTTVTSDNAIITVPTTLNVVKLVVNSGGGTAVAGDFSVNVKLAGTDVSGSPAVGLVTPGRSYSLAAGTYVVSETANPSYTTTFSGACNSSGSATLAVGDNTTCTVINTYVIPGTGGGGSSFAILPLINVTKIPSPLSLPAGPGPVTYTYTATNIGVVPMIGAWVKDDKCSDVKYISGDTNKNTILDVKEAWVYSCTKTVYKTETNAATAHGQSSGWDVYDTANATVVVGASLVPPLIHLEKIPNVFILPAGGGPVTYSYFVTNIGTVPVSDVSITDDKCTGLPGRVVGHPGDLNKNGLLDTNETFHFTCQTNLTKTTTNTGTAEGHANGLTSIDYSSATVVVVPPALPNTGLPSAGNNIPWNIITSVGALLLILGSLVVVQRKRTA